MPKAKAKNKAVKPAKTMDQIIAENEALTSKLADAEKSISEMAQIAPTSDATMAKYMEEMNAIKRTARVDSNKIKVVETTDHKNISLWTKMGKRIGPLHQANAIRTFQLFYNLGNILSTTQPTVEQVESYKLTPEGKKEIAALAKSRGIKDKSRKKGKIEEYMKQIAEMTGQNIEAIHSIVKASGVKPLSNAHAN